jgi:IclR family transcriptional regulator, KDG regulon repressor
MKTKSRPAKGVLVLHKSMDVLEALRQRQGGMSLAELAQRLEMPKPTAHRILATFESRGYLDRTAGGDYRLGRKLLDLKAEETTAQQLIEAARPAMARLLDHCRETLNLGILDAGDVVIIETMESPQSVRMSSKIGNRRFAHSTALGKVLLSVLDQRDFRRIIRTKGLPQFTEATITSEELLQKELERIRQQGFALDNRENELDGRCLAAPIYGASGKLVAALSISGPLPRMTVSRAKGYASELMGTCARIGAALGA